MIIESNDMSAKLKSTARKVFVFIELEGASYGTSECQMTESEREEASVPFMRTDGRGLKWLARVGTGSQRDREGLESHTPTSLLPTLIICSSSARL